MKNMKRDLIPPATLLISGVVFMVCGFILIFNTQMALEIVRRAAISLVTLVAITAVVSFIIGRKMQFLSGALGYIIMAGLIVFVPRLFASSISVMAGMLAVMQGVVGFINFMNFKKDDVPRWKMSFLASMISFIFAIMLFTNPLESVLTVSKLSGFYLLFVGFTSLGDFADDFLQTDYANQKIKPRVYVPVPVFMGAMLPRKALKYINENVSVNNMDEIKDYSYVPSEKPRLEIYIHIGNDVIGKFGHMDMCFDGMVYSYGCYDTSSNKLYGMISDGTIAITPREPYMYQALDVEKKTLIGFGIDVNGDEADKLKVRLDEVLAQGYEWKSPREIALEKGEPGDSFTDPASVLNQNAGGRFLKFKKGKFKTYFSLGTNCVLVAHQIIGSAGAGILRVGGLVTPGTYFAYLNRLYALDNNFVVSRTLYKNGEYSEHFDEAIVKKQLKGV